MGKNEGLSHGDVERDSGSDTSISSLPQGSRSAAVGAKGIRTAGDLAAFVSALMVDVVEARVDYKTATAAIRAAETLIKLAQEQLRYGLRGSGLTPKDFSFSDHE